MAAGSASRPLPRIAKVVDESSLSHVKAACSGAVPIVPSSSLDPLVKKKPVRRSAPMTNEPLLPKPPGACAKAGRALVKVASTLRAETRCVGFMP
jgi:hypothetical protein